MAAFGVKVIAALPQLPPDTSTRIRTCVGLTSDESRWSRKSLFQEDVAFASVSKWPNTNKSPTAPVKSEPGSGAEGASASSVQNIVPISAPVFDAPPLQ